MADLRGDLTTYLRSIGWQEPTESGTEGALWTREGTDWALPVPDRLTAGGPAWALIMERLSLMLATSPRELEERVRLVRADVALLRAGNESLLADTIPLPVATAIIQSGWSMLRSCATTALGARAHIRGNYRNQGDSVSRSARMAHTRRGSFVIPIILPLGEVPTYADALISAQNIAPESIERRVMRTFADSVAAVHNVIEKGRDPDGDQIRQLVTAGVSSEFSAALQRLLATEALGGFSTTFQWAADATRPYRTDAPVEITPDAYSLVERVTNKLKTVTAGPGSESLTGPVIGVWRDGSGGGTVTIDTARGSRRVHLGVPVSEVFLNRALDWMKSRVTVVIEGRVRRVGDSLQCDRRDSIYPLREVQLGNDPG